MPTELCSTIDVLPTVAKLASAPLPALPIDGCDTRPLRRFRVHFAKKIGPIVGFRSLQTSRRRTSPTGRQPRKGKTP